jgi:hypothetical protein
MDIEIIRNLHHVSKACSSIQPIAEDCERNGFDEIADPMASTRSDLLLQSYELKTAVYTRALRELQLNIARTDQRVYKHLRRLVEDACSQHRRAETEVEEDVRQHFC